MPLIGRKRKQKYFLYSEMRLVGLKNIKGTEVIFMCVAAASFCWERLLEATRLGDGGGGGGGGTGRSIS